MEDASTIAGSAHMTLVVWAGEATVGLVADWASSAEA